MAEKKTIFVKLGKRGSKVQEFALPDDAGLSDLLQLAGYPKGQVLPYTKNGDPIIGNCHLSNGDIIEILDRPAIQTITVKVGRVGAILQSLEVPDRSTIGNCIGKAMIALRTDEEIWLHENENVVPGYRGTLDQIVHNGYCIIIEKRRNEKKCAILRIIADAINTEIGENIDWEDLPISYADRIIALK